MVMQSSTAPADGAPMASVDIAEDRV